MEFRIYVRAIVMNNKGQVLMLQKNSDQKIAPNQWLLPGGAVEFGETAEQAIKRELKEETGMIAQAIKLLGEDLTIIDQTHWHGLIYLACGDSASVSNCEPQKHSSVQWCEYDFARSILKPNELNALLICREQNRGH